MSYGTFANTKSATNSFVFDELIGAALTANPPDVFNIQTQYASFLFERDFNQLQAEEEAEKQSALINRRLNEALAEWEQLGLPAPIAFSENENVLLTWNHERYDEITGLRPLSLDFVETYTWLTELNPREFLLPIAVFLRLVGCNPIFVTDGPRDEGIDCIGRIAEGPLRSVVFFVQVKTQQGDKSSVSRDTLFLEYGKYATLPKTEKYIEYLRALSADDHRDGLAIIYLVVSNVEFSHEAQQAAKRLGILLRSKRQIAHFLSEKTSFMKLRSLELSEIVPSTPDLSTNLFNKIELLPANRTVT